MSVRSRSLQRQVLPPMTYAAKTHQLLTNHDESIYSGSREEGPTKIWIIFNALRATLSTRAGGGRKKNRSPAQGRFLFLLVHRASSVHVTAEFKYLSPYQNNSNTVQYKYCTVKAINLIFIKVLDVSNPAGHDQAYKCT